MPRVTIWDYFFHGIPQQRVFARQIRVHMLLVLFPLLTIILLFLFGATPLANSLFNIYIVILHRRLNNVYPRKKFRYR
jgi:hypothetical protein